MKSSGNNPPFRIRKADWIILCTVFALCVCLGLFWKINSREKGRGVEVLQRGRLVYSGSLQTDHTLTLDGNVVIISAGSVHMAHADCPDQICVKTGHVSHANQMITCLPNRVVVKVTGQEPDYRLDSVAR